MKLFFGLVIDWFKQQRVKVLESNLVGCVEGRRGISHKNEVFLMEQMSENKKLFYVDNFCTQEKKTGRPASKRDFRSLQIILSRGLNKYQS